MAKINCHRMMIKNRKPLARLQLRYLENQICRINRYFRARVVLSLGRILRRHPFTLRRVPPAPLALPVRPVVLAIKIIKGLGCERLPWAIHQPMIGRITLRSFSYIAKDNQGSFSPDFQIDFFVPVKCYTQR